ncbi:gamma tubulin complex Spc97/GCP2 subunit Alp4 [Mycoemilia scoparia]|uniref:Gamma tubulin complex Spc97/GCP2 subunit Alp4 n=1 Tax=Mycoemilia scoparia TaxID=417184 RepID=A0A9W8DVR8_9FUNG|nr:gamma tubulin complex Spc97/GCP2 subunit Alp4 [Mycoemilia scoparia]
MDSQYGSVGAGNKQRTEYSPLDHNPNYNSPYQQQMTNTQQRYDIHDEYDYDYLGPHQQQQQPHPGNVTINNSAQIAPPLNSADRLTESSFPLSYRHNSEDGSSGMPPQPSHPQHQQQLSGSGYPSNPNIRGYYSSALPSEPEEDYNNNLTNNNNGSNNNVGMAMLATPRGSISAGVGGGYVDEYMGNSDHLFQSSFRHENYNIDDDWMRRGPYESRSTDTMRIYGHHGFLQQQQQQQQQILNTASGGGGLGASNTTIGAVDIAPLGSMPLSHQELIIMDDILYVMIGIQGKYIEIHVPPTLNESASQIDYVLDETMDGSLKDMVFKILPIASCYIEIEQFSNIYSRPAAGLVNQALCSAIRSLLKDYTVLVAQLEHRLRSCSSKSPFTLQQFWFHIHPTLQVMLRVAKLIEAIKKEVLIQQLELDQKEQEKGLVTIIGDDDDDEEDENRDDGGDGDNEGQLGSDDDSEKGLDAGAIARKNFRKNAIMYVRGGRTLNIIAEQMKLHGGDSTTKQLYGFLLSQASVPFYGMLRKWLRYGKLGDSDPNSPSNGEFMIKFVPAKIATMANIKEEIVVIQERDDTPLTQENKVILKFVLESDLTPMFMKPFGQRIILTGKYLNVVKACGVDLNTIFAENSNDIKQSEAGDYYAVGNGVVSNRIGVEDSSSANTGVNNSNNNGNEKYVENSDVIQAMKGREVIREINLAYVNANRALLKVLLNKDGGGRLKEYLRGIKRYLLFDQSDFITHFLDLALRELNRPTKDLAHTTKLQSLLDIALRNPASVTYADPYKEHVQIKMARERLLESLASLQQNPDNIPGGGGGDNNNNNNNNNNMLLANATMMVNSSSVNPNSTASSSSQHGQLLTCIEALNLNLYVTFPATMVLHPIAKNKYSMIHRHLLALKYLEQRLCNDWHIDIKRSSQSNRKKFSKKTAARGAKNSNNTAASKDDVGDNDDIAKIEKMRRSLHLRLFGLRNRMLQCIQQILYYSCWEVIEPNWNEMIKKIEEAATVDELIHTHTTFLDLSLRQCGLSNIKLTKIFTKVITRCHQFLRFTQHHIRPDSALYVEIGNGGGENVFKSPGSISGGTMAFDSPSGGGGDEVGLEARVMAQLQSFENNLKKMEDGFKSSLKMLVDGLNFYARSQTNQYLNLAVRLDYSQYYAP